jgi:hypothetical protein
MSELRQLFANISSQKPGFNSGSVHVEKLAMGDVFSEYFVPFMSMPFL